MSELPKGYEDLFDYSQELFKQVESQFNLIDIVGPATSVRDALTTADGWVQILGAEKFQSRQYASRKLQELGSEAIPAMFRGLKSDDPEIRHRCKEGLRKYSPAMDMTAFSLLQGPAATIELIDRLPQSQMNDERLKLALAQFPDKDVPQDERKAIDDYFDRSSTPQLNGLSTEGTIYALKRLFNDVEGNYLAQFFRGEDDLTSTQQLQAKLLTLAKKFPSLCTRDTFILKAAELFPGHSRRPATSTDVNERSFIEKLPPDQQKEFEKIINHLREFERGQDFENFRRDVRHYKESTDSDRLVMRLRAQPYLMQEPLVLQTLSERCPKLLDSISRTLPTADRLSFQRRMAHIAQVYSPQRN